MAVPGAFLSSLFPVLGHELEAFEAALQQPPVSGLRTNPLKITPTALQHRLAAYPLTPVPWCPTGFRIDSPPTTAPSPGKHPLHAAGLYYVQDPSAMAVAEWLAPQPGERVLDLCSAPGGKATHLAGLMNDEGVLVANETVPARAAALVENLERWGVRRAVVTAETPARLAQYWPAFFDRVLVDAPCSGEGMFRRQLADGVRIAWSPAQVQGCARRQRDILRHAAQLVRPGGWLLYSTCTFNTTENEDTVQDFLREQPTFTLAPGPRVAGMVPGDRHFAGHDRMARLWPHHLAGEGHFLALMQRRDDDAPPAPRGMAPPPAASRTAQHAWEEFCQSALTIEPAGRLVQTGTHLFLWPDGGPAVAGLRVLRPGWWLGELRHDRFVPSHALALALTAADFAQVSSLPADSAELMAYGRGEPLSETGADGWLAVCVEGYPLGWGKRSQGVIKNHYPKGLRWHAV
jgi:16S rRNA C967 or C1407 C5-methylase (RsmB/RsmF family)/NOL1/NOP2/fmu family ribosome biogenesis protein